VEHAPRVAKVDGGDELPEVAARDGLLDLATGEELPRRRGASVDTQTNPQQAKRQKGLGKPKRQPHCKDPLNSSTAMPDPFDPIPLQTPPDPSATAMRPGHAAVEAPRRRQAQEAHHLVELDDVGVGDALEGMGRAVAGASECGRWGAGDWGDAGGGSGERERERGGCQDRMGHGRAAPFVGSAGGGAKNVYPICVLRWRPFQTATVVFNTPF
jgi:hypothetical protein